MGIIKPSAEQVAEYQKKWNAPENENYVLQERSLKKLFTKTYPRNDNMDDVFIKVCSLNDFYSTQIYWPIKVAERIFELNIDNRLEKRDRNLVNDIATINIKNGESNNFYSCATKYCYHHFPNDYPIYDHSEEQMLMHFKRADEFCEFKKNDLKNYPKYYDILMAFKTFYHLEDFTLKQIDRYLCLAGKEYFPQIC